MCFTTDSAGLYSQDFQKGAGVTWMSKRVCNAYIAATKLARTVMFNGSEASGPLTTSRASQCLEAKRGVRADPLEPPPAYRPAVIETIFAVGMCTTDAVIQVLARMLSPRVFYTNSLGHCGRWTPTCLVSWVKTLTKLLQNQSQTRKKNYGPRHH